uniref:Uncharacterized protein n=1 Tax=Macaca fascicularis TaxID=9541 RepID=Q9BE60_MACFA|nr:hypothetical protein [Macaca fascicularis]
MECPEGKLTATLSERKRLLCLLLVLPASHPMGTPVLQVLLPSRCTCKRLGTGKRAKSSCSDTSWQAKISCCCYPGLRQERQQLPGQSWLSKQSGRLGLSQEKKASCGATEAFCLHSVCLEAIQEQL